MQTTTGTTPSRDDADHSSGFVVSTSSALENPTATVSDVLARVVQDVGALIPAERSLLFLYDKNANLLKLQFVSNRSSSSVITQDITVGHARGGNASSSASSSSPARHGSATTVSVDSSRSGLSGFPPVMGMISACFLHKRCLRMQEPHPVLFSVAAVASMATRYACTTTVLLSDVDFAI
ncbi:hypothetical protein PybrP1_001078 [[Pythium] brassicae (nom. inval.)]|nr:hypothetical protein PybrP1_001078 [[Pythium] brassicae (nom. inval.)]